MHRLLRRLVSLAALLLASPSVQAQVDPPGFDQGSVGLGLALRQLATTARVLYVTAHPDDENNAVLAALSRGNGVSTAVLTLTRGEGGQNAIGAELGYALGVLRTGELIAAHGYDGADQFFAHAYDFGFSFDLQETLTRWGEEETLSDIVRVIRLFRPDVVLTLPHDAADHQHHAATSRLTANAFRAAGDPARFPEQMAEGLRPWQARALFEGGVGGAVSGVSTTTAVDTAHDDPLLGLSWSELGGLARSLHRSQGIRQLRILPGEAIDAHFVLRDAEPAFSVPPVDLLDIASSRLSDLKRFIPPEAPPGLSSALSALVAAEAAAESTYDLRSPHASVPALIETIRCLGGLSASLDAGALPEGSRFELRFRLGALEHAAQRALASAEGISLEAFADDGDVVPGQAFTVKAHVFHRGPTAVSIENLVLHAPEGWEVDRAAGALRDLRSGQGVVAAFSVRVSPTAEPSRPYWHKLPDRDRYALPSPEHRNLPFARPELSVTLHFRIQETPVSLSAPVVYRFEGRVVGGERRKPVAVVPDLSVLITPEVLVFPRAASASREVRVGVENRRRGPNTATVGLEVPLGWMVTPRETSVDFFSEDEEAVARFILAPPADPSPGEVPIRAVVSSGGREFREGFRPIVYDHVPERSIDREAVARALVVEVQGSPGAEIGYVMGVGDETAEALRQLGLPVTLLTTDDLAFGDLARYSTIVVGVRAYYARPDLRAHHARLMRFVEEGGHLLVQYQRAEFNPVDDNAPSPYAPFPARVTTKRVTDETAPIEMLMPGNALLTTPNRLGPADWEGWVQERGIQFLDPRDGRYRDLLAAADPFRGNPGRKTGLLVEASVGKGSWTYVGLALFRQLPAGVPGAYRLLANLVSRPRGR